MDNFMPKKRLYNNEETVNFSVRLPISLRDKIEAVAYKNRRSVNQEIVNRLQQSFEDSTQSHEEEVQQSSH